MWDTDSAWFDVAVVMSVFALGNILFGHFEKHRPKWRRVLKVVLVVGLVAVASSAGLRWIGYAAIGALAIVAVVVHGWWLPRNGINGWTGEPKAKYYELRRVATKARREAEDDGRAHIAHLLRALPACRLRRAGDLAHA